MQKSKAFTLIELLVVIAIIALLLSVVLPALKMAKRQAQAVICRSNLKQWALVYFLYTEDNDGSFPQSIAGGGINAEDAYFLGAMLPYYKDESLRMCAATKTLDREPANFEVNVGGTFIEWGPLPSSSSGSNWWDSLATGSYGFNDWCADPPQGVDYFWTSMESENAIRKIYHKNAYKIPIVFDCVNVDVAPRDYDLAPSDLEHQMDEYAGNWSSNAMKLMCIDRHQGGIDVAFIDLHVEHVGIKRLWRLQWHENFNTHGLPPNAWPDWLLSYKDY
jgi:prepilin-type N-terminal cleavage/methylation domain-containing protein/prepilin-type processing-associated H-X9-DG protein